LLQFRCPRLSRRVLQVVAIEMAAVVVVEEEARPRSSCCLPQVVTVEKEKAGMGTTRKAGTLLQQLR
jgi:hypothetical protein